MKKLGFLFFLAVIIVGITGCMVNVPGPQKQALASHYDVVVDNQTRAPAVLVVDGNKRRNIPSSEITKFQISGAGRLFTVKFSDGKSFHQNERACRGDMVIITISSDSRGRRTVNWEKSQGEQKRRSSVSYYWLAPYPPYPYGYGYGYSHRWHNSYRWRVR